MPRVKTKYYPDYGPLLPFAGPDWVWQRAYQLVDSNRNVSLSRDGPDIARVMRYPPSWYQRLLRTLVVTPP